VTTSVDFRLERGRTITGKWKQGRYRIGRLLGEGANGKVYLVEHKAQWYALKVGGDTADLQSEINVLQSMAIQKRGAEPFLVAVDDFLHTDGSEYPFYVMRYVRGSEVSDYLFREGPDWFPLIGFHLLGKLAALHEAGWAFGDLKQENVLVGEYGRVELVDYGGVTAIGRSVRQFTEVYDRGYWSAGSRTANETYDLFSFAVLCIHLFEGNRLMQLTATLLPQNRVPEELFKLIQDSKVLQPFAEWLRKALLGKFRSAREAAAEWQRLMYGAGMRGSGRPAPKWMGGLLVASIALLVSSIVWLLTSSLP
jgi:serine/threonine protein kinase